MKTVIVGVTGASGSVLAQRLLEIMSDEELIIHTVITKNGSKVFEYETGEDFSHFIRSISARRAKISEHKVDDMFASIASGSANADCMVIAPCSMATAGKIASGCGDSLLTRAADVCLKEKARLVLVTRETPLNSIHLRNLLTLSEAGAVILPPVPMFYSKPKTVDDLIDNLAGRILKSCGIKNNYYEKWGNNIENV